MAVLKKFTSVAHNEMKGISSEDKCCEAIECDEKHYFMLQDNRDFHEDATCNVNFYIYKSFQLMPL